MKIKTYLIIIVILIIISLLILVKNYNENIVGEKGTDAIELNKDDMKICCEYTDEQGETKTCTILNDPRYDCKKLCSSRCII